MTTAKNILKKLLDVKDAIIDGAEVTTDGQGVMTMLVDLHLRKGMRCRCPYCSDGRRRPKYDTRSKQSVWRDLDFGGVKVKLQMQRNRVDCLIHGIVSEAVPWAYPESNFTKRFDLTVAWMARQLNRSAIADYMRIDWDTVGRCVTRARNDLEPDIKLRLDNLHQIGIDETSYKRGHKYITVVVNHETNTVVWMSDGHGKAVLTRFFEDMTEEQRRCIQVVTGDGAQWIDQCMDYIPQAIRCVDAFHVVQWAMEALDDVRREVWHEALADAKALDSKRKKGKGRTRNDDEAAQKAKAAKKRASEIKGSTYALGKAPEHLTENQRLRCQMIELNYPRLFRAYRLKEELRLILKGTDPGSALTYLNQWFWRATHSRIPAFKELGHKIRRHQKHILDTIRMHMSNARIEATNNKIKVVIRRSYGFRNLENMFDLVYLCCSNLRIPLPNRPEVAQTL